MQQLREISQKNMCQCILRSYMFHIFEIKEYHNSQIKLQNRSVTCKISFGLWLETTDQKMRKNHSYFNLWKGNFMGLCGEGQSQGHSQVKAVTKALNWLSRNCLTLPLQLKFKPVHQLGVTCKKPNQVFS